uniref:AGRL2-4 GAIN subdomain A domain-containing protein n=1 Tax=Strix occidentalis caurina TaxID=311401 RepID=A0A8D0G3D2_STROC
MEAEQREGGIPPNLLRVGSALLDTSNKRHWELIQQTEGGTAWLLKHFEDYASALAQNMPQTYLSPFTIVTPNIGERGPRGQGHVHACHPEHVCAWGTCLFLGTCVCPRTRVPGDTGMCVHVVGACVPRDGDTCVTRDTRVTRLVGVCVCAQGT